ncbi:MAG: hypothetical protein KGJ78_17995 [Alphaproteobacteria bacterium]|nr:hypothetical protein [Alphaproteobacteria bacterium]
MPSRRGVIAGGAGAAVLAALGYRAWDRGVFSAGEGRAYAAWNEWQGHAGEGPARRPLHAAILAASAHNSQPWMFEPHEDSITVYADLSRNLGAADPCRRELYASIGCALANLQLAALTFDLDAIIHQNAGRLEPTHATNVVEVAKISLIARMDPGLRSTLQPLVDAIPNRHTNRGYYQHGNPVDAATLGKLGSRAAFITDKAAMKDFGALIVEGTRRFIADRQMSEDSGRWLRTGRREVEEHRDGIATDNAGLSSVTNALAKLMPDQTVTGADRYWLASTREVQVPTAAAFGVLFTTDRFAIAEAIAAGTNWQMLHLAATSFDLAAQPLNQPIEMMDRDLVLGRKNDYGKEIRRMAGVKTGDPAFIFRLGYPEDAALPSPRRPFDAVIRSTGVA